MNTYEQNECQCCLAEAPTPNTEAHHEAKPQEKDRIHFLDNLRTFVVFLVVLCHAGWVYESSGIGAYFWIVDDPAVNNAAGLVNVVVDIFMMPTLFLISGYLAPASLRHKGAWRFVKAKSARLLLPWLIGALTLVPLYKVIFLYSRGLPQDHWTRYLPLTNSLFGQVWLWFLPVLFSFNMVYLLLAKARIRSPKISLKGAVLGVFLVGFGYSVAIDTLGLRGWTKIGVLDFQTERLLIYFLAFLLGAHCFRLRVFDGKPQSRILFITVNAIAWVPVMVYIIFLLYPLFHPDSFIVSPMIHRLVLWLSFHLSLLCLAYLTIETFRRYLNTQGKLRNELNRNSYYVYIIHVIVMGVLALIMLNAAIPSLLKYSIVTISTFVISHLLVSVSRGTWTLSQQRISQSTIG